MSAQSARQSRAFFGDALDVIEPELLEARWRLGVITTDDLHGVASDSLDAGVELPSVIELFALTPDELRWQGPQVFDRVLLDLGARVLDEARAASVFAHEIAGRLLDGTIALGDALGQLAAVYVRTKYTHDVLFWAYDLKDELDSIDRNGRSFLGRSAEEIEGDARREATRIRRLPAE